MEVVSSVVGKVVDSLFSVAKKEISYISNYSENVENFKNEVEKLSSMKGRVQQQIDLAKSKGELLLEGVEDWMSKADSQISDATKFVAEEAEAKKTCFNLRSCVNLNTLHHYGKAVTKRIYFLRRMQEDGKDFEACVSLPAPTPGFADIYQKKNLENIDTQKWTLEKIIKALEDDTIQIVGINGLGGVGKTTLASEIAVKMKNQFDDIVFVVVSQTSDVNKIQETVKGTANRIIMGQKVLIILDDVWEELKLDALGIPFGSDKKNCKILLTSRSRDVCEAMNAQKIISVDPLQEQEAWTLFERVVGKSQWDDELKRVALEIVKECGGLPLFIQTVGKALKNKETKSWEATLDRLKDPTDDDVPFKRKGIMQLKLSYDYLESEIAKSCFLLCGMFPEDGVIGLKRLTYYGMGLGIFNNHDISIQDAKSRVQLAVDSLKSSFLLLPMGKNYKEEELFKMHDLVRDMAILITSKGNDKFWVQSGLGLEEWQPKKHLESYKKISLMRNQIEKLPDHELRFPNLDTFLIQDNFGLSFIPDEFFCGMEEIKVLDMSFNQIRSLPASLKHLTKLRILDLSRNYFITEISILGDLTCLEILKLRVTGITNIPKEMGQLTNLRLLDVYSCRDLSYVTPGVISKLTNLEELYVGLTEGNCNFLQELSQTLKILHLKVPGLHHIPEDFHFETLIEFLVEDHYFMYPKYECKRILHISKVSFPLTLQGMKLIQASEMLILWSIEDMNNIVVGDLYLEGCDTLKCIEMASCHNIRSLGTTSNELGQRMIFSRLENIKLYCLNNLELLWDRPHQYISFRNLAKIKIKECSSLLELFPLSVALWLVNLKEIQVVDCKSLVVVISDDDGDGQTVRSKTKLVKQDTDIVSPLERIILSQLPKVESFYSGHSIIEYPSLTSIKVKDCTSMKRWSYGENHIPNLKFELERRHYSNINNYIAAQVGMKENMMILQVTGDDLKGYHASIAGEVSRKQARSFWLNEPVKILESAVLQFRAELEKIVFESGNLRR